jgi:hypothetical protein
MLIAFGVWWVRNVGIASQAEFGLRLERKGVGAGNRKRKLG